MLPFSHLCSVLLVLLQLSTFLLLSNRQWGAHAQPAISETYEQEQETDSIRQERQQQSQSRATESGWLQENFPHPERGTKKCRATKSHRLCDPDGVLSPPALEKIEEYLQVKKYVAEFCSSGEKERDEKKPEQLEIQMGVALVQKMDLRPFKNTGDREEQAAEIFARYVHDDWGVGVETGNCGGAGFLLFLSIEDRAIYISRGAALEATLTDRRLDQVMDKMKDSLRSQNYDGAILQALEDMRAYIEQGPPTTIETFTHIVINLLFPILWIAIAFGKCVQNMWQQSRHKRDYAMVASQLNEIERTEALALQGRYRATSCPICLEDFEAPPEGSPEGEMATKGSDGKPIKLLRCGHVMDETCWVLWVNNGSGTFTKCPICQQDIAAGSNATQHGNQRNADQMRQRNNRNAIENDVRDGRRNDNDDRIVRQYRRERNFRLARLGRRYPQIIRPAQIQRWSQPNYDGSLVRDPSFVQSNPAIARPGVSSDGGTRRSGGFGGSSSGGGRGGRW